MTAPLTTAGLAELGRLGRQAQNLLDERAGAWFEASEGCSHGSPRDGFAFDGGPMIAMRYDSCEEIEDWAEHRMPAELLTLDDEAFRGSCATEAARRQATHARWLAEKPAREAHAREARERDELARLAPRYAELAARYGEPVNAITERRNGS